MKFREKEAISTGPIRPGQIRYCRVYSYDYNTFGMDKLDCEFKVKMLEYNGHGAWICMPLEDSKYTTKGRKAGFFTERFLDKKD
jgi:hypothetical protein